MTTLKVPLETVDAETGEVVERTIADFKIVPPTDPLACKSCARRHGVAEPHDATALHYQYTFLAEHGRWPTWKDAVAHCPLEVRAGWEADLRRLGHWPKDQDSQAPAN